ncbi:MAG TPA: HAD-IA family hydrolase [Thermoplasmata archaeon]|nr:HAD-IA family hydrolase [Thermoplasmata archaeon]
MPRFVFLDFGGTLVAPLRDPYPVYRSVLASNNLPLERSAFDAAWARLPREDASAAHRYLGRTDEYWAQWDRRVLRELGIDDGVDDLGAALRREFVSPRWHVPFPEARRALDELRPRGHELHLVSNNTEDLLRIVANLGWGEIFASITYSQEVGAEKPEPRIFRLALSRARADPRDVVHVGDSWESDVEGARAVGIAPIWLAREGGVSRDGVSAVPDLTAALQVIGRLGRSPRGKDPRPAQSD